MPRILEGTDPDATRPEVGCLDTESVWRTSPRTRARRHRLAREPPVASPPSTKVPMGPERKEEAMSAQGGTLAGRGTMHLPIWPVAALVVAAIAAAIGMSVLGGAGETRFVTSVTDAERFANSTAAVREQGAVLPAIPSIRAIDPAILEQSSAAVREQGAVLPFETTLNPGMWTIAQAEAYVEGQLTYTH